MLSQADALGCLREREHLRVGIHSYKAYPTYLRRYHPIYGIHAAAAYACNNDINMMLRFIGRMKNRLQHGFFLGIILRVALVPDPMCPLLLPLDLLSLYLVPQKSPLIGLFLVHVWPGLYLLNPLFWGGVLFICIT